MKIGILAGEPSGDLLGHDLIVKLREIYPQLTVTGIGGPLMKQVGCESLFDMERLSVMGFVEPLKRLPELFNIRKTLANHFIANPPDVFIGIDSPDFNLGLELILRRNGIRVVHYVSPSVWAWRQNRIKKISKATDLVLTLLPFEAEFYEKHQIPVRFVGHPLADRIALTNDTEQARLALGLDSKSTLVALMPGSRRSELKHMGELFIETAKRCWSEKKEVQFITSSINAARDQEFRTLWQTISPNLPLHFFTEKSHLVMQAADVILVTSGTATLEAMLFKKPMVIAYRIGYWTYQLAKLLVKVPFIGLPNLLAKESLVPEFIQERATPENLSAAILQYINQPETRKNLAEKFVTMHQHLKCDASRNAALAIASVIKQ